MASAVGHALVTGASRGIGRAIAAELARRGWTLHLASRSADALEEVRRELPTGGASAGGTSAERSHRIHPVDLGDMEQVAAFAERLRAEVPRLGLLVLNAGAAISAPLEETSLAEWDRVFDLNVRSPFLLTRELLPALRAATGRVIAIGSVVSTAAYPGQGAYTASKHALYGLTKVLAKELHADGVIVQTVLPGGVATDMVRTMRPDIDSTDLIQPQDVAAAVGSLLDMDGSALTDEIRLRRRGKSPWA